MGVFGDFKMDVKKEQEGIPVTYSANKDGSIPTFYITRMSPDNLKWKRALERATRPVRRQLELETLSLEHSTRIRRDVFVNSLLIGWDHVQDENDKEIPYSPEAALKLFEALPELFNDLESQASKAALFRAEVQEKEAKN